MDGFAVLNVPCLRRTRVCIVPCQMALLGSLPGIWSRPRCRLAVCLILLIVHALSPAFHCRLISSEFRSCVKPWFRVNLNCQVFVLFVCKFTLREAEDLLSCIVEDYSWTFGCAPNKWNRTEQLCAWQGSIGHWSKLNVSPRWEFRDIKDDTLQ